MDKLRAHGLTRMKAQAIREVAALQEQGALPSISQAVRDPEATISELQRIQGVGPWTASLAVAMVHPEFPTGPYTDLAVARGLQQLLGYKPEPRILREALGNLTGLILYLAAYDYESKKTKCRATNP